MSWRKWGLGLSMGLLTLSYPVIVYLGLQHWSPRAMALVLVALVLLRVGSFRRARARAQSPAQPPVAAPLATPASRGATALLAALLAMAVLATDSALPLKFYPVLVNATMLVVFGWSLRHPPSLIERLARLREPDLPPRGVAYTRRVTQAWCLFFVANGTAAMVTALWASDRVWALYNGAIAYVLIGAMFAGEWLVRQRVMARPAEHGHG
ncbi:MULTISPECIES: COG4648 family protein [unclassified Cupriavidus]|uniref:COG4648 family protein n=1 Tax=Cupriavidus sp. H19C3 TaxID=3241603 RepID=UPI003BF83028